MPTTAVTTRLEEPHALILYLLCFLGRLLTRVLELVSCLGGRGADDRFAYRRAGMRSRFEIEMPVRSNASKIHFSLEEAY